MEIWANLSHEHILAFYGVVTDVGLNIHMVIQLIRSIDYSLCSCYFVQVSPWQENGNVLQCVDSCLLTLLN